MGDLRRLLMLALYRAGRQADALAAYQDARTTLVGDLGIDPGEPLQRLEAAILAHDPSLVLDEALPAAPKPAPRQPSSGQGIAHQADAVGRPPALATSSPPPPDAPSSSDAPSSHVPSSRAPAWSARRRLVAAALVVVPLLVLSVVAAFRPGAGSG